MRRLFCFLVVLFALMAVTPLYAECLDPPGDITADGNTNVVDVQCEIITTLWQLSLNSDPTASAPDCLGVSAEQADVDCTDGINVTDAVLVIYWSLETALSAEIDANSNGCPDACDGPPDTWTCDLDYYGTEDGCDCNCGAYDPDCDGPPETEVFGCANGDTNFLSDVSCNDPLCTDWTCDLSYYDAEDGCDCECGIYDPDCDGPPNTEIYGCSNPATYLFAISCTQDGTCSPNPDPCGQVDCDDNNACTTDSCDPSMGCINAPTAEGSTCDDGNTCTYNDTCTAGECQGTNYLCDDDNVCTEDTCLGVPVTANDSCVYAGDGECDENTAWCLGGTDCSDCGNCGLTYGQCQFNGLFGEPCDDSESCTVNQVCDAFNECVGETLPDGAECNDGNNCSFGDTCEEGVCKGENYFCDDSNQCTEDTCTGFGILNANNSCSDALNGICDEGSSCLEFTDCEDCENCDEAEGECVHSASALEGAACEDNNTCTLNDTCLGGTCMGIVAPELLGESCDDSDPCTVETVCQEDGTCMGILNPCDDGNPCSADACHIEDGCIHWNAAGSCDDGDACTILDACTDEECVGVPLDCDDENDCTEDLCDPIEGCVSNALTGDACNDGNECTQEDSCFAGECIGIDVPCPPTSWTCDPYHYGTDDGCDCECGAYDPDCNIGLGETDIAVRCGIEPAVGGAQICNTWNKCVHPEWLPSCDPNEYNRGLIIDPSWEPGPICPPVSIPGFECDQSSGAAIAPDCNCDCGAFDPDCVWSSTNDCPDSWGLEQACNQDTGDCEVPGWDVEKCGPPEGKLASMATFGFNNGCDCECGVYDPDCALVDNIVTSNFGSCGNDPCVDNSDCTTAGAVCTEFGYCSKTSIDPSFSPNANNTMICAESGLKCVPDKWIKAGCNPLKYDEGTVGDLMLTGEVTYPVCDCECGIKDPDCDIENIDNLGWGNPIPATTTCPDPNSTCLGDDGACQLEGWNCHPSHYGTNDGCHCECGAWDPDCDNNGPWQITF